MTKPTGLSEPLARALHVTDIANVAFEGEEDDHPADAALILAALRADPQTLVVIAEALHPPVPPCRVCGAELTIAKAGGGDPTEYACSTEDARESLYLGQPGSGSINDTHYSQSKYREPLPTAARLADALFGAPQ